MIDYKEGDRGFKVKAEDTYGYITISTLPVTYKTIPGPSLTLTESTILQVRMLRKEYLCRLSQYVEYTKW